MTITPENVDHIADLARIALSLEEREQFLRDLPPILEFVGQLDLVDTTATQPVTGGTILAHVLRADAPLDPPIDSSADELARAAHTRSGEYVRVQKIF